MSKVIVIPAGTRKEIFTRNFSSVPKDYSFVVKNVSEDGQPVSGSVEIRGSNWIFRKPVETRPLQSSIEFHAGYWDTFFTVWVVPDQDVEVSREVRRGRFMVWLLLVAFFIAVVAIVLTVSFLAGS